MPDGSGHADVAGTLMRDNGGFVLRADRGVSIRLLLHRVPVDLVEKRVQVTGLWIDEYTIEADGVAPI
ncbi:MULTISPECIES: DUF5818 domain-containing protein [unclassified Sphingopyxis]|uniref:DUF5818 domain-containing protein n=1 Tax=unclassified Sphingopyxis TaxID=2614943 RepID=UPI0007313BE4|nr:MULTISPECIES: DUF5818 domain-containing protein [unclassified Sphingopyxis]KTE24099.1 hypothetical protein ATE61_14380 [Sphingopyxis sp. H057]KTE50397.1 hypothetical protein ATE64_16300 [Sphingopyxis sp. H073]KTE52486.1 hypothetical protein ATE69_13680 [Sphingopyxis sp. H071]KTE62979.1 hypothetical protein ATE66_01200 [Sphingopyxis sp. H107]KTE64867.1 hypothetical protein ATE65_10435 [Sphingopyxis sp. H100]